MAFFKLAELFVELSAKGLDVVRGAVNSLRGDLSGVDAAAQEASAELQAMAKDATGELQGLLKTANSLSMAASGLGKFADFRLGGKAMEDSKALRSEISKTITAMEGQRIAALAADESSRRAIDALTNKHLDVQGKIAKAKADMQALLQSPALAARVQGPVSNQARINAMNPDELKQFDALKAKVFDANGAIKATENELGKLHELFEKGGNLGILEDAQKQLKGVRDAIPRSLGDRFTAMASKAKEAFDGMVKGAQEFGKHAQRAFTVASVGVLGWVTAGLRGTTMGEALTQRMSLLSREIASVFLPMIRQVVDWVGQAFSWFRSLNSEQAESIRRWTVATLVGLGVAAIFPKIIAGIMGTIVALGQLALAIAGVETETGIGVLLPILGAIATAVAGVTAGIMASTVDFEHLKQIAEPILAKLAKLWDEIMEAVQPVIDSLGGEVDGLLSEIGGALEEIIGFVTENKEALTAMFDVAADGLRVMIHMTEGWLRLIGKILDAIRDIGAWFSGLPDWLKLIISPLGFMASNRTPPTRTPRPDHPGGDREHLSPAGGQRESIGEAFMRVQQTSLRTGIDYPRRIAENTAETNRHLARMGSAPAPAPAIGR
jgi:hypothetical protein